MVSVLLLLGDKVMSTLWFITLLFGVIHFIVDFCCVSCVEIVSTSFGLVPDMKSAFMIVLVYDLVAFLLQAPVGHWLDMDGRNKLHVHALVSLTLVLLGLLLSLVPGNFVIVGFAAAIFVALGNALFHCVGGIEVLSESYGLVAPSGVFIATGVLGVFLGGLVSCSVPLYVALFGLLVLGAFLLSLIYKRLSPRVFKYRKLSLSKQHIAAALLLLLCIGLRSYTGMCLAFPWKIEMTLSVVSVLSVMLGKACGGVLADKFGMKQVGVGSLLLSAVLFLFSYDNAICGILATFLFNMTMAITLFGLADLSDNHYGLAFGSASFAIGLFSVPALLGYKVASATGLCALAVISAIVLFGGLKLSEW